MADYKQINCDCGHAYLSKEISSRCPSCGKQHFTWEAIGVMFLIGIALLILLGLMFGALAYALYLFLNSKEFNRGNIKWHFTGVLILSICSLSWFNDIYSLREYPIMSWITYLTNSSAILLITYHYFKFKDTKSLVKEKKNKIIETDDRWIFDDNTYLKVCKIINKNLNWSYNDDFTDEKFKGFNGELGDEIWMVKFYYELKKIKIVKSKLETDEIEEELFDFRSNEKICGILNIPFKKIKRKIKKEKKT